MISHYCCLAVYPFWERLGELTPTENQELESRRRFGKIMPNRLLLRCGWLVPKQYRHPSFPWIHRPRREGGLLSGQQRPYTLSRLRSSTGEDIPALLHRLMQTRGCRRGNGMQLVVFCSLFIARFQILCFKKAK